MNLVLYSGEKSPYPYALDIYDCFEDPVLARALMFKPLDLIDLGQLSQEELLQHGTADLLEILLKQGYKRTFLAWIKEPPELIIKLLERYYGIGGLVYIFGVEHMHSDKDLIKALDNIQPNRKKNIMTAGQEIRQGAFIEGYVASYATRYAADMALKKMEEEFSAYFLDELPRTPLPELLQTEIKEGIKHAISTLLGKEDIKAQTIAKVIGWSIEEVTDCSSS